MTPPLPGVVCSSVWLTFSEGIFLNIQSKFLLAQLETVFSFSSHLLPRRRAQPHLAAPSQGAVEAIKPTQDSFSPGRASLATSHQTCASVPSSAPLPFSGYAPAPQFLDLLVWKGSLLSPGLGIGILTLILSRTTHICSLNPSKLLT